MPTELSNLIHLIAVSVRLTNLINFSNQLRPTELLNLIHLIARGTSRDISFDTRSVTATLRFIVDKVDKVKKRGGNLVVTKVDKV